MALRHMTTVDPGSEKTAWDLGTLLQHLSTQTHGNPDVWMHLPDGNVVRLGTVIVEENRVTFSSGTPGIVGPGL